MVEGLNRFVCPNDRQLSLRAKLKTGWSVKTCGYGYGQNALEPINVEEQQTIVAVIKRNEELECLEQERVGKLMERLEKLRRNALGRSMKQCLLCGCQFGFLGAQKLTCTDCQQSVCHKCSIDGSISCLCLICSETREIWKKSGAWFFKSFPKYIPPRSDVNRKAKEDVDNDSSDDDIKPRWRSTPTTNKERRNSGMEPIQGQEPGSYRPRQMSISESQLSDIGTISSCSDLYWSTPDDRLSLGSLSKSTLQEGQIRPDSASLGVMELSLTYDTIATTLHCTIHRCRHLTATDINGLSDPYCRVNVLPCVNRATRRLRTKTVHKTRNPEFNECLTFYEISGADLQRKALHVIVIDEDRYGDDGMGEIRMPLAKLRAQHTLNLTMPLERPLLPEWYDDDVWRLRGQILLSLTYSTRRRALLVTVMRCANLLPMDANGYSDPFVKLCLRPDAARRKQKTSTKRKSLNPVYNEEFVFDSRPTQLAVQTLHVAVWDKDFGKPNDYLGGLLIGGAGCKGRRLKHWLDMIRYPDRRHELWHNLTDDQDVNPC